MSICRRKDKNEYEEPVVPQKIVVTELFCSTSSYSLFLGMGRIPSLSLGVVGEMIAGTKKFLVPVLHIILEILREHYVYSNGSEVVEVVHVVVAGRWTCIGRAGKAQSERRRMCAYPDEAICQESYVTYQGGSASRAFYTAGSV